MPQVLNVLIEKFLKLIKLNLRGSGNDILHSFLDTDHEVFHQNGFHTPIHNDQEILSMMEANGQYPLLEKHESRQLNGIVNGAINGHINGDCDMQEDHSTNNQNTVRNGSTHFNQAPIRCLTLCGHLQ